MLKFFKWLGNKYVEEYAALYANASDEAIMAINRAGCTMLGISI